MVSVVALWLPVLLSGVLVFVVSSIIHMVLSYHAADAGAVPDEAKVMDALRPFEIPPGDYAIPRASSMKEMGEPAFIEKTKAGPVAFITVLPNGPAAIGTSLARWFGYSLLVGAAAGYTAGLTLGPGTDYGLVFHVVGTVAFAGYSLALLQDSIWWNRSWRATFLTMFDGLIYALLTAGTFGWLWP
jgi:hypothetical protein